MPMQNTPIASRKYLTEDEMENPVRTTLSVSNVNLLEMFLEANELVHISLGYYTDYNIPGMKKGYGENRICYSCGPATYEAECNIMHMKIKYGGIIEAFEQFRKDNNIWR